MSNKAMDRSDDLARLIKQARSMAHVMDTEDFEGFSDMIKANYRWALWTLLDEAEGIINTHHLAVTSSDRR